MDLTVTAAGAIASVGRTASEVCGAVRAGLAAPRPIEHYRVLEERTQEMELAKGHPVHAYTEGFVGLGRSLRLALGAANSLLFDSPLPPFDDPSFWGRTELFLVGPSLDPARWNDLADEDDLEALKESQIAALGRSLRFSGRAPRGSNYLVLGAAGTARAMLLADQLLGAQGDRALIVAADSYLDTSTLDWLVGSDRLKSRANPVGLMPGEAGACLLVERKGSARRRGLPPGASITSAVVEKEPNDIWSGRPNVGEGLERALRGALDQAGPPTPFEGDVYSDHNGEAWRATEWGNAQGRLDDVVGAKLEMHWPAMSLGDVGAASAAMGVVLATHALGRGYAVGPRSLVLASSEYGDQAAIVVQSDR